jgi:cytochrome c oxidase subunit 3
MPTRPPVRPTENFLTKRREPMRFLLWTGMLGSTLIFGVLLLAYLVRRGGSDWEATRLPMIFWASTVAILVSSFTLHEANRAFSEERFVQYRRLMGATLLLGGVFMVTQLIGGYQLHERGDTLQNSVSSGFIYLLSGLHLLHLLGGVIFLAKLFIEGLKHLSYVDAFVYSVNPPNLLKVKLVALYWHFVDVLWIVLFLFLLLNAS